MFILYRVITGILLHPVTHRLFHKAGNREERNLKTLCKPVKRPKGSFYQLLKFFIWQAIVRGPSVSTEGPFFCHHKNTI
jgi:hypothetical protein